MEMAMVWNNSESFKKHVEQMRMFRKSHPNDLEVRGTLLKSMPTSLILQLMRDTGGSRVPAGAEGWSALIPIRKVTLPGGPQN